LRVWIIESISQIEVHLWFHAISEEVVTNSSFDRSVSIACSHSGFGVISAIESLSLCLLSNCKELSKTCFNLITNFSLQVITKLNTKLVLITGWAKFELKRFESTKWRYKCEEQRAHTCVKFYQKGLGGSLRDSLFLIMYSRHENLQFLKTGSRLVRLNLALV
jgi:hypothetical protein